MKKSIFIQLTSYHDYELPKTIVNAVCQSSQTTHINFGVHSIFYQKNDILLQGLANVKVEYSTAPSNLGMGLGRQIAHSFYDGEDYYIQVDAHSRFDKYWDTFLIDEVSRYKAQGFSKPLITNYPKPFWYEGDEEKTRDHVEIVTQFFWKHPDRFLTYRTPMQGSYKNPDNNVHSISVSGGSIFTEGPFLNPNPKIFADGEEIFMAARAFTNGYDLLLPKKPFMYHLYYKDEGKNQRRLVCKDWPNECAKLEKVSKDEIFETLFGEGSVGDLRLGTDKTLAEYGEYCGLDFRSGKVVKFGPDVVS